MARTDTGSTPTSLVNSVVSSDTSLIILPSTGNVDAIVNEAHAFDWTALHTFNTVLPTSILLPSNPQDFVNLQWASSFVLGFQVRPPCVAKTTAALPANTYNNGTLGVGATLTANANGALPAQDGVSLLVGDRLLVGDEATLANNGAYEVTDLGSAGTPYILTRVVDFDQMADMPSGTSFPVTLGTLSGGTQWYLYTPTAITVGTTAINFYQYYPNQFGYTPEDVANKTNDVKLPTDSAIKYPTEHATKQYAETKVSAGFVTPSITSAIIFGFVNDNGFNTTAWYETPSSGPFQSQVITAGSGTTQMVSYNLTGLTADTEYFFRVVASNVNGVTNGPWIPFRTLPLANTTPFIVQPSTVNTFLRKNQNLADLVNFTTSRSNLGVPAILPLMCAQFNPADATTYYFGAFPNLAPTTTANVSRMLYPFARTINRIVVSTRVAGTLGSAGNVNLSLRINGSDFAYGTFTLAAANGIFNISPGTVIVPAGATIEIKILTPTWTTNPQQVSLRVDVYLI